MRISLRLVSAWLLLGAPNGASALADGETFIVSTGVEVPTPPIETLDCTSMIALLAQIDDTGYRRGASAPDHSDDLALLIYENRLARRFYAECVRTPWPEADGDSAFRGGYDDDVSREGGQ